MPKEIKQMSFTKGSWSDRETEPVTLNMVRRLVATVKKAIGVIGYDKFKS